MLPVAAQRDRFRTFESRLSRTHGTVCALCPHTHARSKKQKQQADVTQHGKRQAAAKEAWTVGLARIPRERELRNREFWMQPKSCK
jgi:hypothetical protein